MGTRSQWSEEGDSMNSAGVFETSLLGGLVLFCVVVAGLMGAFKNPKILLLVLGGIAAVLLVLSIMTN